MINALDFFFFLIFWNHRFVSFSNNPKPYNTLKKRQILPIFMILNSFENIVLLSYYGQAIDI